MKVAPALLSILLSSSASANEPSPSLPLRGSAAVAIKDDVPDVFEPAISLDEFAALDSNTKIADAYFEWVDREKIQAGETTCGFLHAPLCWPHAEEKTIFPEVEVCKLL